MKNFFTLTENAFGASCRPKYHPRAVYEMWDVWYTGPGIKAIKVGCRLTRMQAQKHMETLHFCPHIIQKGTTT